MPRLYRIRPGCSFRLADGTLRGGGEPIWLDDDVARLHADKIVPAPAVQTPALPAEHEGGEAD